MPLVSNNNQSAILDIAALTKQAEQAQEKNIKVVFLCSPGNPTGNLLPQEQLKATIELFKDKAIVVVDEAYIEFCCDKTVVSWISKYENLVVLRTLSKAFALAGLRCGFTLANTDIITLLSKIIAPYPVPAPVATIASQALSSEALRQMSFKVRETNLLRDKLALWLTKQNWCEQVFNSDANFVLFKSSKK